MLLPHVENLILGNFIGGEHERQQVLDIVEVFLAHADAYQRSLGSKENPLDALSPIVKEDVRDLLKLTINRIAIHGLNLDRLAIDVLIASYLELLLFRGEFLDDLFRRKPLRRGRIDCSGTWILC